MGSLTRSVMAFLDTTPFLAFFYVVLGLALLLLLTSRWWVRRFRTWYQRHYLGATLGGLLALFLIVFLAPDLFFSILPGETGVLWSRFGGGTQLREPYPEGTFMKLPWDRIYKYDLRYQRVTAPINAITREGLEIRLVLVARSRPMRERVAYLHKHVGPDYVEKLVLPELGALTRQVVATRSAEEVYSVQRGLVQQEIYERVQRGLIVSSEQVLRNEREVRDDNPELVGPAERVRPQIADFIELEDLLIQAVTLPESVARAIESKIVQLHLNEEYVYRLARERNEVLRKGLEGEGIALFQSKVSAGISDRYLKWKGIDATLELAKSQNAKIVVIGSGEGGMPLILGGFAEPTGTAAGAQTQAATAPTRSAAVSPEGAGAGSELADEATNVPEADALVDRLLRGEVGYGELVRESIRQAEEVFAKPGNSPAGGPTPPPSGDSPPPR